MRETLLAYLFCPECQSPFDLIVLSKNGDQITEGLLHCVGARHVYPIVRSIPRILLSAFEQEQEFTANHRELIATYGSASHAATPEIEQTKRGFGRQWNTYQVQRPEEDLAYFCSKTGVDSSYLGGKLVLDAGCGSGRYSRIAGEAEAIVIGVDLSLAVETAASNTSHLLNVHILQSDIFQLPFKPQLFQFIYSIGVLLHHTPDTKKALFSLIPLLTNCGEIAIWLYPRWPAPVELYNQLLRAITTRMSHETLHRLAVGMEPLGLLKLKLLTADRWWRRLFGQLLRGMTIGVSYHPDRELRICDTFDWFSPPYQWHHTNVEVESWFRELGFRDIVNLSIGQNYFQHNYGHGVNFKARRVIANQEVEHFS